MSDSNLFKTLEFTTPPPPASPSISTINSNLSNDDSIISSDQLSSLSSSSSSLSSTGLGGVGENKYSVASHTVRITKHGFAIDPIELKNHDIIGRLSTSSRRNSNASFDSNQVGHKILAIIRGFWSQPGFPRGKFVKLDSINSLESIFDEFSKNPTYPHRETFGNLSIKRVNFHRKKKQFNLKQKSSTSLPTSSSSKSQYLSPTSDDVPVLDGASNNSGFVNLSLPTSKQPDIPTIPAVKSITTTTSTNRKQPTNNQGLLSALFGANSAKQTINKSTSSSPSSSKQKHNKKQQNTVTQSPTFISWIPKDKEEIFDLITILCKRMQKIFSREDRIINIPSPCTVLGDIHGNLIDLRTYERSLWPKAPICVNSNYLFLGDYVDRGDFSIECVLYLFAMKLLSPNRFFLLRGNHEVAAIQRQYTFSRECDIKFGPLGKTMWRNFNKVFDLMPIAAIVDNSIFCAHGGIPRSISDIRLLARDIPTPLDNPEVQCPSAWEILWNDPITDSELIGMIEMDNTIVTQTQTIQTQPSTEGNNAITTTVSTTIVPESLQRQTNNNSTIDNNNLNAIKTTTSPLSTTSTDISEADAILSREPAVALSFYIRPANQVEANTEQQQQQQQQTASKAIKANSLEQTDSLSNDNSRDLSKEIGLVAKKAASQTIQNNNDNNQSDDNTLRTVPSDTSSIASTSPQQIINDGFVANIKRGTAYLFSDQAINHFLKLNNLSHVIRAHEVIPTGFAFHGDGRVITIFSSSKYCGLNNQAACALIDQNKIRIFRLDTGEAGE